MDDKLKKLKLMTTSKSKSDVLEGLDRTEDLDNYQQNLGQRQEQPLFRRSSQQITMNKKFKASLEGCE